MNGPPRSVQSPFWTIPLGLGGLIFVLGVLIWVMPDLLAYIVAAGFCALGLSVMGIAWRMRPRGPGSRRGYVEFRIDRDGPS